MIRINLNTEQQIKKVFNCPLGARVLNPEYGSRLYQFADSQATNLAEVSIELARAIEQNLQINVQQAKASRAENGFNLQLQLENQLALPALGLNRPANRGPANRGKT